VVVVLFLVAAVALSGLLAATVLVSVASRREDSDWSLGEPARGPARLLARHIVGFHAWGIREWPRPVSQYPAYDFACPPASEEPESLPRGELLGPRPWPTSK
jgi:hypothetical protein